MKISMRLLVLIVMSVAITGFPTTANAAPISHVTDVVVSNGDGTFRYSYTVFNDSAVGGIREWIIDWELPWFGDAGIALASITVPDENGNPVAGGSGGFVPWNFSIETIGVPNAATGWGGVAAWQDPADPMYAGPGSPYTTVDQVLHWYCDDVVSGGACSEFGSQIREGESLGGFGFVANFGPTPAPYQASWLLIDPATGDPAFPLAGIPNSPLVNQPGSVPVPEPSAMVLLGSGLLLGLWRRLKYKVQYV